jgi:hypothetical protein
LCPAVNDVVIWIAEKQKAIAALSSRHPHGAFGEEKATCKLLDLCVGGDDLVKRWVFLNDLGLRFANRYLRRFVEVQSRGLDPDEVLGAIGPLISKDRKLNLLSGLGVPSQDHTIWGVETFDYLSPGLSEKTREFAVDPDFSIVINNDFECDGRACGVEIPNLSRNRKMNPILVEANLGCRAALVERCRIDCFPLRVVEVGTASTWFIVVGLDWRPAGFQVWLPSGTCFLVSATLLARQNVGERSL